MSLNDLESARVLIWKLQINFSQYKNMQKLRIQYMGVLKTKKKGGGQE
jgi:hypothetical protein